MLNCRAVARWACLALGSVLATATAVAQSYPDKPIKLIVGFPPGQSTDSIARQMAAKMSEELKQTVYVDNRAGAAGIIAHQAAKDSAADGYTILMGSGATLAINPSLYRKLPYDPVKDFEPIVAIGGGPLYLFTSSSKPVNDLKDFTAYVKASPGKVTYGSGGNGITSHIAMEMLKKAANVDLLHVPYKGSPAVVTDIIGGQIDFAFDAGPSILPHAKAGRVKLLGVSSAKRWPWTPEVPTLAEQGISGFEALTWVALLAPKGTPAAIVERLNAAANKALKSPEVTAQMETVGLAAKGGTPAELQAFIKSEMALWGKAVRDSGAQVD
jgi:tripartite-type tricarboxylate transporter receptor subunit TctC